MKNKLILSILLLLGLVSIYAQAPLNFSARLNITNVSGSDPYTLVGVIQDDLGLWSASDLNTLQDSIYHLEGSDLLIYRITTISSAVGNNFTIIVDDVMNSGILPSTGTEWAAMRVTTNYQFPVEIGNLATNFKASIDNRFKQRLDEVVLSAIITTGDKNQIDIVNITNDWRLDTNSVSTVTIADDAVTLAKQASGTANRLQGFDASGNPSLITVSGISTLSAGNLAVTEVDGSSTNELQTVASTSDATSHTVTLSNSGGSFKIAEGSNITITTSGTGLDGVATIASTGVSESTTASNGLTLSTLDVQLGGNLTQNTAINGAFDLKMGNTTALDTVLVTAAKVILDGTSGTDIKRSTGGRSLGVYGDATWGYIGLLKPATNTLMSSLGYGATGLTGSLTDATFLRSENALHLAAGGDNLYVTLLSSGNFGLGTVAPTNILSLGGEANRTIWMERRTTAASNGNNLIVQAGGGTVGGTNRTGGNLLLYAGTATGTGGGAGAGSNINFATSTPGSSGTSDVTVTTKMTIQNNGNVGIGTGSPVATALLEMQDTARGFLKPRLTTTQRNAIASPATGLEIYNTTTNQPNYYSGSGWVAVVNTDSSYTFETVPIQHTLNNAAVATGDGNYGFAVPLFMDNWQIVSVTFGTFSAVSVADLDVKLVRRNSSGTVTDVATGQIGVTEYGDTVGSLTFELEQEDYLYVNVPSVGTSVANGLSATVTFKKK